MGSPLAGKAILILNNEAAPDIAGIFERAGAYVVIGDQLNDAVDLAKSFQWSAAVIDHGFCGRHWPLVRAALAARRIPCIFYTNGGLLACGTLCLCAMKSVSIEGLVEATECLLRASRNSAE